MNGRPFLRTLSAADVASFATFSCASWNEAWTLVIEELIRDPTKLAYSLHAGELTGVGAWLRQDDLEELAGLAAWKFLPVHTGRGGIIEGLGEPRSTVCWSALLAVDRAYRRQGVGRVLKQHVIDAAIARGAVAVVSEVHWDNEAMLRLNWRFGADNRRQPEDADYALSVIPLPLR